MAVHLDDIRAGKPPPEMLGAGVGADGAEIVGDHHVADRPVVILNSFLMVLCSVRP